MSLRVELVHIDLGLGGAERLMVDAATMLARRGHRVRIWTARHPGASYPETRDGSLVVEVRGAWLPRNVGGRLIAACSIARGLVIARALCAEARPDVVLVDGVPHVIPALKRAGPVVYYGHHPDRLLARAGGWYRAWVNGAEERGLAAADAVLANSAYTKRAFVREFPDLREPQVVPPGVDLERFRSERAPGHELVVVQRFDALKNLDLAVETLAILRRTWPVRLAVLGRLDPGDAAAGAVRARLTERARALGVADALIVMENPTDAMVAARLAQAALLMYTPVEEHFGIVPLEAMAAGVPVVACRGGGVRETVVDGVTGVLAEGDAEAFARACAFLLADPERAERMGKAGRERAREFSREAFGTRLEQELMRVVTRS